ncbi:MAG: hypothetical protein ACI837_003295 [Crocinitomicaceae bacterium]|jgi:hypothetical protein
MKLLIMKTNIKTKKNLNTIVQVFDGHSSIYKWTLDREDKDNVLRIEADENLREKEITQLINAYGFHCEEL